VCDGLNNKRQPWYSMTEILVYTYPNQYVFVDCWFVMLVFMFDFQMSSDITPRSGYIVLHAVVNIWCLQKSMYTRETCNLV
jgi:hypothetical protein